MVATFCLRLAFGMIGSLLIIDPAPVPPRFFRVQYLASLGLLTIAGFFLYERLTNVALLLVIFMCVGFMCLAGSVIWHLDESPGGNAINCLTAAGFGVALFVLEPPLGASMLDWWPIADHVCSAALLGTVTSAMLLGHSYLISPSMTIAPLRRMLIAGAVALVLRVILALCGLWFWTAEHPLGNLDVETQMWLTARWFFGILAPLALGWMAWETARIRSTQSATGILYVVVIVCFLGELTSLLLLEKTGSIL